MINSYQSSASILLSFLFPQKKRNKRKLVAVFFSIHSTFEIVTISVILRLLHGADISIRSMHC